MLGEIVPAVKRLVRRVVPYGGRIFRVLYAIYIRLDSASRLRRKKITDLHIQIHATEHCNLNCKSCNAFCPIIDELFADVAEFDRDLSRLSELTGGRIGILNISGGEPTLHPRLPELMSITRGHFPQDKIQIITNGLLLTAQEEAFWSACSRNNIAISLTSYPIELDIVRIKELAKLHAVSFSYQDDTDIREKTMSMYPLDPSGGQDIRNNYRICYMANFSITLENGRIYTCPVIPHIRFFNEYFGQDFRVSGGDYRDIYKVSNIDEILDSLCRPAPFCRYCNKRGRVSGIKWEVSKRDRGEWM